MPKVKEQLFEDFVKFVAQHGYGEGYTRDPHQAVPPDCGFVRFRYPGAVLFTSAGIVKFHKQEEGVIACKTFVESSNEPIELQMNFPRESPQNFPSPTFAEAHEVAKSRWRRLKRSFGTWWH
jgi:hypothetical protein